MHHLELDVVVFKELEVRWLSRTPGHTGREGLGAPRAFAFEGALKTHCTP
ncbi:MAG TPA: hypothetical protein VEU33_15145 [Archangium sp.]|nr:hypothetical protein [Archangium sp.]